MFSVATTLTCEAWQAAYAHLLLKRCIMGMWTYSALQVTIRMNIWHLGRNVHLLYSQQIDVSFYAAATSLAETYTAHLTGLLYIHHNLHASTYNTENQQSERRLSTLSAIDKTKQQDAPAATILYKHGGCTRQHPYMYSTTTIAKSAASSP